ncbi:hypothetical protein CUMW_110830 [Citrus unshiu]|nr:hypothetical protein CUMW_110830 [Citrus unshiu]
MKRNASAILVDNTFGWASIREVGDQLNQMNMDDAWTCMTSTLNIWAGDTDVTMLAEPKAQANFPTPSPGNN